MLHTLLDNFCHNLFKPLLLFFYAGFMIPLLGIGFDFPQVLYQSLTIFLLLAIGWRGGEELAELPGDMIGQALGFMVIGFIVNSIIGVATYYLLRKTTRLRQVDAATVAGYYGSDSAGTFVTCLGVLTASQIAFAAYMPVMLAVMEIPGCLVALVLVAKLRRGGLDAAGFMPSERVQTRTLRKAPLKAHARKRLAMTADGNGYEEALVAVAVEEAEDTVRAGYGETVSSYGRSSNGYHFSEGSSEFQEDYPLPDDHDAGAIDLASESTEPAEMHLTENLSSPTAAKQASLGKLLHEVFLNPGSFLLFAGLVIGCVSRLQGETVVTKYDTVFVALFQGLLCLFLLEMGMTAAKRLKDLKSAGWQFAAFAVIAPNVFATFGMIVAHLYSMAIGQPFALGTYALFAVLCGAASYIALPAVQRMAIPEASPTLPLAASLGLTFSYNVTIGVPVYLMIATLITQWFPVVA